LKKEKIGKTLLRILLRVVVRLLVRVVLVELDKDKRHAREIKNIVNDLLGVPVPLPVSPEDPNADVVECDRKVE
jgi:hypothetical protein